MELLETNPYGNKKCKSPIGSLRVFVPVIELKNKGVEQRINKDRNYNSEQRVGAVWIFSAVEPACSHDIPNDETDIGKGKNKTAFVF